MMMPTTSTKKPVLSSELKQRLRNKARTDKKKLRGQKTIIGKPMSTTVANEKKSMASSNMGMNERMPLVGGEKRVIGKPLMTAQETKKKPIVGDNLKKRLQAKKNIALGS